MGCVPSKNSMYKAIINPKSRDSGIIKNLKDGIYDDLLLDYDKCKKLLTFVVKNNKKYLVNIVKRLRVILDENEFIDSAINAYYDDQCNLLEYHMNVNGVIEYELIDGSINRIVDGKNTLMRIIENDKNIKIAQYVYTKSIDINHRDNDRKTPLMYAIMKKKHDYIHRLLSKKADVKARDKDSKTVLMYACEHYHECINGIINILSSENVRHNAKLDIVNAKDINGKTALDILIENDTDEKYINILIDFGADINLVSDENYDRISKYNVDHIDSVLFDSEYELDISL